MTVIVDYGAGNLTSVQLAFRALGIETIVTRDAAMIASASRVVFPGVGAAKSAMANLETMELKEVVRDAAISGKPFLGICLGMQILFERSEEDGGVETLGVFPGTVRRFPEDAGEKVPEIGWNQIVARGDARAFTSGDEFYFVHSYCADVIDETTGVTTYAGREFTALVQKGNLWAAQFHPEKSGRIGLKFLKAWTELPA